MSTTIKCGPKIQHRKSVRLQGYDYSLAGGFFITIVSFGKDHLFGEVVGSEIKENCLGLIIAPGKRFYTDHSEIEC